MFVDGLNKTAAPSLGGVGRAIGGARAAAPTSVMKAPSLPAPTAALKAPISPTAIRAPSSAVNPATAPINPIRSLTSNGTDSRKAFNVRQFGPYKATTSINSSWAGTTPQTSKNMNTYSHTVSLPAGSKPDPAWASRVAKEYGNTSIKNLRPGGSWVSGGRSSGMFYGK